MAVLHLQQDDVARTQPVGRGHDGAGQPAGIEDGRAADGGRRADAGDADGVQVAADLARDRGAVVAPADVGRLRADHAALVLDQVLVREAPRALAVDDLHVRPASPCERPGIERIDAAGCRAEIALARGKVGRDGRRRLGARRHDVEVLALLERDGLQRGAGRRLRGRGDVGSGHRRQVGELLGEIVERLVGRLDLIVEVQVRHLGGGVRRHAGRQARDGGLHPLLGFSEQRLEMGARLLQCSVEARDVHVGQGRYARGPGAQGGLRSGDRDENPSGREPRIPVVGPWLRLTVGLRRHGFSSLLWTWNFLQAQRK